MSDKIAELLKARQVTCGDFDMLAWTSQEFKAAFRKRARWHFLTWHQKESLDLIATKIARILNSDIDTVDHWDDIAGYAQLISNDLRKHDRAKDNA